MKTYDIAVIGAGAFGAWTAWHLRRTGASVLLLEAWSPGHSRASSGGESRIIRAAYGADAIYTRMAMTSLALWKEVCPELFYRTGVLWIARDGDEYSSATQRTLIEAGVPIEILRPGDLSTRYPQMRLPDGEVYGIHEPEGGVLLARRAVRAVADTAGADYRVETVAWPNQIPAGIFVFACGPWLPKLFPDLLGERIHATRQEVFFFAPPTEAYTIPVWLDFTDPRRPYGLPNLEGRGIKIALDRHGPPFDPDTGDRLVRVRGLAEARQVLGERFPAMRDAPLAESRVCQYENTRNGDFVIDRHPEFDNVWIAGGGSGHGFKHGPAVGKYLCGRILGGAAAESRFSI